MSQVKRKIFEGSVKAVENSSAFITVPVHDVIDEIFVRPVTGAGVDATQADAQSTISMINLQIDGNDVVNCTYKQLVELRQAMGTNIFQSTNSGAVVGLNISRLFLDNQEVRDAFGWGDRNISNIQLRIECGVLTNVAAFEVYTVRRSISRDLTTYFRAVNYQQQISGAGPLTVTTLPKNSNDIYYLMMLGLGTNGAVNWNRLRANGANITDQIPETVNDAFMAEFQYQKPTGTSIIPLCDGALLSGLPANQITDIQAEFNFTTKPTEGAVPLLLVTLHNPNTAIVNAIAS